MTFFAWVFLKNMRVNPPQIGDQLLSYCQTDLKVLTRQQSYIQQQVIVSSLRSGEYQHPSLRGSNYSWSEVETINTCDCRREAEADCSQSQWVFWPAWGDISIMIRLNFIAGKLNKWCECLFTCTHVGPCLSDISKSVICVCVCLSCSSRRVSVVVLSER